MEVSRQEDDEAEETQEARGGPLDGASGPLPLGLDAQMHSCFFERDLKEPYTLHLYQHH
jgi:hypothetical protein